MKKSLIVMLLVLFAASALFIGCNQKEDAIKNSGLLRTQLWMKNLQEKFSKLLLQKPIYRLIG